jgi:hypothetical protein
MQEKVCDLWLESAEYRCVLTSGSLTSEGEAILDTPSARQAAERYHGFGSDLGRLLASRGNHAHVVRPGLISFPVRQFEWAKPSPQIIERSARELVELVGTGKALLPRPGCGDGELDWETVKAAIAFLPDNIIVVHRA